MLNKVLYVSRELGVADLEFILPGFLVCPPAGAKFQVGFDGLDVQQEARFASAMVALTFFPLAFIFHAAHHTFRAASSRGAAT